MTTFVALLAATLSFAAAADAPAKSAVDIDAAKIFAAKCTACHAKDGKGNAKMAKMFKIKPEELDLTDPDVSKKSDADLVKLLHEGKDKMPAFKSKLKDPEIDALIAYIRGLSGKAAEKK